MKFLIAVNDFETSIFPMRLTYRNSIQNASGSPFGSETACDWKVNMSQIQPMAMMSHVTVSGTIFTASGTYKLEVMHLDLKGRPNVYIYNVHNVHIFRLVDTTYIHAQTLINRLHMANHIECQFYV